MLRDKIMIDRRKWNKVYLHAIRARDVLLSLALERGGILLHACGFAREGSRDSLLCDGSRVNFSFPIHLWSDLRFSTFKCLRFVQTIYSRWISQP